MPRPPDQPRVTLTIAALVPGGAGLARETDGPSAGRVVFVPGTAPGDRVEVALTHARRRHAEGRVVRLLQAGPARTTPFCPLFGTCGGCAWQHVTPAAQATARAGFVRAALRRVPLADGGPGVAPLPLAAGAREGHRARVRLHLASPGGVPRLGFHAARTHDVVDVPRCPVATPAVGAGIAALRAALPERLGAGALHGSAVLVAGDDPEAALSLRLDGAGLLRDPGLPATVWRHTPTADGRGVRLRVSAAAFAQAHLEGNRALVAALLARWPDLPGDPGRTAELFAGGGNLTVPLALGGARVLAVERGAEALADLVANVEAAGVADRVTVLTADVRDAAVAARLEHERPERVLLDPPREGARDVIDALAAARPRSVVYVSCDPATLGRDAEALSAHGYVLWEALPVDLFPETPHVETLAVFVRR